MKRNSASMRKLSKFSYLIVAIACGNGSGGESREAKVGSVASSGYIKIFDATNECDAAIARKCSLKLILSDGINRCRCIKIEDRAASSRRNNTAFSYNNRTWQSLKEFINLVPDTSAMHNAVTPTTPNCRKWSEVNVIEVPCDALHARLPKETEIGWYGQHDWARTNVKSNPRNPIGLPQFIGLPGNHDYANYYGHAFPGVERFNRRFPSHLYLAIFVFVLGALAITYGDGGQSVKHYIAFFAGLVLVVIGASLFAVWLID